MEAETPRPEFSASSLLRRRLCPGSLRLERKMAPTPDDEYSELGKRLHAMMADKTLDRSQLSDDEVELLETTERLEQEFVNLVLEKHKA